MKTSIVIPVVDQLALTKQCITAIRANTAGDYELIVVDNGSKPSTADFLRYVHLDKLIRNETNKGFGYAVNQGWEVATGDIVGTINNDTIPGPGWLECIVQTLKDSRIGVTGKFGGFCRPDWTVMGLEQNYPRSVDYIEGSCLFMRREVYEKTKGFSRKYEPAYCEDTDLSIRIRRMGLGVYCRPDMDFQHLAGQTSKDVMAGSFNEVLARNLDTLKVFHGECETVLQTHFPVTLMVQGKRLPHPMFIEGKPQGPVSIPRFIQWQSTVVDERPNLDMARTEWVLLLKDGETCGDLLLKMIPQMLVPGREAWMIPVTGGGKEPRLFQWRKVTWNADACSVMNTQSGQAGDYRGPEGIVNA